MSIYEQPTKQETVNMDRHVIIKRIWELESQLVHGRPLDNPGELRALRDIIRKDENQLK